MATSSIATRCPQPGAASTPRRHDRLPSVRDHDDITGLEVRCRVFQEAEVVTGCVAEAVDGHGAPSIDRSVAEREVGRERVPAGRCRDGNYGQTLRSRFRLRPLKKVTGAAVRLRS